MFEDCTSLTQAPALPATTMTYRCYAWMFNGCTALTQAPALPATTLANYCYYYMFQGCTSLTKAPALPATTLADYCYFCMFYKCTSLTKAPALPATTLASDCYSDMFNGCTSLTQAPALPATTLVSKCYSSMFLGCTSLTKAPALPATTLVSKCYSSMFLGCTSLTKAPALPATTLADYCYRSMFSGCTSLKLSSNKTDEYTQEYRIPTTDTGTTATDALIDMFINTGGTFTGTPSINTTYYLSTDNMIVRDTEVATLNGYVGSMIDGELTNIQYPVTKVAGKTGEVTLAKGDVGLGNVDNTSDVNKPVSTKQQEALNGKQAKITASGLLKGNGSGGVSAAVKGTDYAGPSVGVTAMLTSAGWDSDAKTQTVSVAEVTATANGSLRIAQSATDEQFTAWGAAQPRVTAQAAGTLTVKVAGTVPTIDIPVEVLIV